MVKRLLSLAAIAAMAVSANAYVLPLTSDDTSENAPLNAGWGSTYDQATKTITYEGSWNGRGWGFWEEPFDGTNFTDVVIKFADAQVPGQLVVQYSQLVYDEDGNVVQEWDNDKHEMTTKGFAAGDTEITITLNAEFKDKIDQIYLQCGTIDDIANPIIVLESAEIVDNSGAPINYVAFEGEQAIDWWEKAVIVPAEFFPYLVEGSKIAISVTPVDGSGEFKIQTYNADWSQTWLPGLADVPGAEVAEDGTDCHVVVTEPRVVECPVTAATAEVIAQPGVQNLMIVGANIIVTKVEIIPAASADCIWLIGNISGWTEPSEANAEALEAYKLYMNNDGAYEGQFNWDAANGNPMFRFYTSLNGWEVDSYGAQEIDSPVQFLFNDNGVLSTSCVKGKGSYEMTNYTGQSIKMVVDLNALTVEFTDCQEAGVSEIQVADCAPVYYNMQGMRVANPAQGKVYIVVRGNKAAKEVIR